MAILGLRGSGNVPSAERPSSWREGIIYWHPNGEVPLMALGAMGRSEPSTDYEINWFDKGLPSQRVFINNAGGYSTSATSLNIDDGAGGTASTIIKSGIYLMNERTFERLIVTADPTVDTLTVARGKGATAAAVMNNDDGLLIIGTSYEDGASASTSISYDPTRRTNYNQIFNRTLTMTRREGKMASRTGDRYAQHKYDCWLDMMLDLEKSAFWGDALDEAGSSGAVRRTFSGGFYYWVTTNVHNGGGTVSVFELMDFLEDDFRTGSSEKLCLAGSTWLNTISKLAKLEMTMNSVPGEQSFGLKIVELITPFGVLYLKNHPLLSDHPVFRAWGWVIDLQYFIVRYLDDVTFIPHVEVPGSHRRQDEFYADMGWEIQVERAHAILQNFTNAV